MRACTTVLIVLGLLGTVAAPALAGAPDAAIDRDDQRVMSTDAFLNAHPDMKYRREGWLAFDAGRYPEAIGHFTRAAGFGDKISQAMLAEMAWKGQGQPANRPLGYAWADLAAERGYRQFVALREQYWAQLTAEERVAAIAAGRTLLPVYSHDVTRVALAQHLRKARWTMVSGRINRSAEVRVPGPGVLWTPIRGHDFYAEKFWNPARYQEWTDAVWTDPPRENVEVGAPVQVDGKE
jgi:hypothetical protein